MPCARDCVVDAVRRLCQFFLSHREIPYIVSSNCATHFTGDVYRQFCSQMSIILELHGPWRPQISRNIEWQHRTMKNALYMLCKDRNCEWTDILKSVTSSINATINSATDLSPFYTITGHNPNIGLPKLHKKEIANDNLRAYGIQINALHWLVHNHITLANNEANHNMKVRLNRLTYKDPIQVSDKVKIHRPQSAIAQSHCILDTRIYDCKNKRQDEPGEKRKWW